MTAIGIIGRTSLMAGLLGGTAAFADVTAQQVWDNWKDQMSVYGETGLAIGAETMSGDTLTVESLTLSMEDADASVMSEMGPITFTEVGDGTVRVGLPESYPLNLEIEGTPISATISQENLVIIASGDPDAIAYEMTGDRYAITVDSLGPEFDSEGVLNAATIAATDLSGTYVVRTDNLRRMDYLMNIGAVEIAFDLQERAGSGVVVFNGDIANLIAAAKIAMPLEMDPENPESMFVDGFAFEGGYTVAETAYDFNFDVDGEAASGNVSVASAGLEVAADIDGFSYAGEGTGLDLSMLFPNELPFPIEATMAEYGFNFDIPLSQAGAPRDVAMGIALRELTVSDGIWNMIDPGTILPRDAATAAISLTGKVTPFFDFLDPAQQEAAAMSDIPGEVHEVTMDELTLRIAGAEVTGTGAFTFDNSDFQTIPGVPRPEGQADFQLNGINGLIDKLIQMGLIPEDEAMMPRMMLGMFATPVGDDQLTSTIEINAQGHILANGQRLQ